MSVVVSAKTRRGITIGTIVTVLASGGIGIPQIVSYLSDVHNAVESNKKIQRVLARDTVRLKYTILLLKAEIDSVKRKRGGNAKKIFPAVRNLTSFLVSEMTEIRRGNITLYLDAEVNQYYYIYNGLLYEAFITPSRRIYWRDWDGNERYLN